MFDQEFAESAEAGKIAVGSRWVNAVSRIGNKTCVVAESGLGQLPCFQNVFLQIMCKPAQKLVDVGNVIFNGRGRPVLADQVGFEFGGQWLSR